METFLQEISYALRALVRNPALAVAAVLTLALGIGANTAIFSVVHGVLLRPLPYPDADRIHVVWNSNTLEGIERDVTSFPTFTDWRERGDVFEAMAGFTRSGFVSMTDAGEPEQLRVTYVTEDFLRVFGVTAALGRGFTVEEMRPGSSRVALLGAGLWQRRFGGDRTIVGRSITLNGEPYTVAGVMPPSFAYPADSELWLPLAPEGDAATARGALWLSVIGRLRADVEPALAQQRMDAVAMQLQGEYPASNTGAEIMLEPLHETIVGDVRTPLLMLLGAVAVVLLIGCANVANLLLARGAVRRKELSLRAALGAGRGRVARQLLTESGLLSLVGGVVAAALAIWAVSAIVSLAPAELPRLDGVRVDGTVLGFTLVVSVITGLIFGLAPLLQVRHSDVMSALRDDGRSSGGRDGVGRLRPLLVSGEVALALVLLVAAGLLIRSFVALNGVDPGFDAANTLTFRTTVPAARYESPERVRGFHTQLQERLAALRGVRAAGATSTLFISRLPNMSSIALEGDAPRANDAPVESVVIESATPGLFAALGTRLISTLEQSLAESLAARRFIMVLLASFAALAATLAAIGIYGVVSYLVAQRTRELGIRMALGAHRRDVLRLVIGQSLRQVLPGVVIGAAAALALTRLLQSQLFGVAPHDPLTFAAVALGLIAISTLATWIPARRAATVDPVIALRRE